MSKDVVIAGVIVAACLGLVVVAFTLPKKSDKPAADTASLTTPDSGSATPGLPGDSGASFGAPMDNSGFSTTGFNDSPTSGFGANPATDFGTKPATGFGNSPTSDFGSKPVTDFGTKPTTGFGAHPANGFGTKPTPGFADPLPPPSVGPSALPGLGAETPAVTSSGEKSHVVAKGETLGDISMKHYNTSKHWKKIAEANKVDPSSLQVGTKLVIPEIAGAVASPAAAPGTEAATGDSASYKIKSGDTYYTVAKKELGSAARWKEVEKLNKIAPEDLRVGMTIKLPKKAEAASAPAPVAETPAGLPGTDTAGSGKSHVVAAGETLGDISRKYYGTTTKWRDIAKANAGVEPETLKVGQKLAIPEIAGLKPAAGGTSGAEAPASMAAPVSGSEYIIKPGDTLDEIAAKQLGKKSEGKAILDANPGLDPRRLRIGQKIVIPGKSAGAGTVAAPASSSAMPGIPADAGGFPSFPSNPSSTGGSTFAPPPANPDLGFNPWLPPLPPKPAAPAGSPMP